ncbi:MAG: hypothetical protein LC713_02400, partial [Actinobacteria bacterium]|nr:hypothetical protein [Actinomycetota bacterium]
MLVALTFTHSAAAFCGDSTQRARGRERGRAARSADGTARCVVIVGAVAELDGRGEGGTCLPLRPGRLVDLVDPFE